MADTIVSLATAPGKGAIAVIRLSGKQAFEFADRHVHPWPLEPRVVHLCEIRDSDSALLDQSLVAAFNAPNSFTGEDVVEISSHGGLVVPQSIVAAFITSGARQAERGEFTRRAVVNGKLDLTQAEAIADLIDARSRSMQKAALLQLDGALSRRARELRESLLGLEAFLSYDIDFPEEDDGPMDRGRILSKAQLTLHDLQALLATGPVAEIVRDGAVVVIAGPPNVGKSSLFNALVGYSRAIVTDIPGTTRDALEAVIDTGDFPLRIVDTAGLRSSEDYVEQLGIEVSKRYLAGADVIIACAEGLGELERISQSLREISSAPLIGVLTKSDLVVNGDYLPQCPAGTAICLSTLTGQGVGELIQSIEDLVARENPASSETPLLTRARHLSSVALAISELEDFLSSWQSDRVPATIAATHIGSAVHALEELIGFVDVEHVLDRVFSSFCVGK